MTAPGLPMDGAVTPTGRYIVARHWHRWAVQDGSWNPPKTRSTHDTAASAQAEADRLNHPPQRARQTTLFDTQEAAS
jgi:hypothetical protein